MKARCENTNEPAFKWYGGRGIKCLLHSPQELEEAIGPRPDPQHSVDRIDSNGHYAAGNIRWATQKEQQRNRRNNRVLTWQGKSQCIADWAKETGLPYRRIYGRLRRGWSAEQALSEFIATRS